MDNEDEFQNSKTNDISLNAIEKRYNNVGIIMKCIIIKLVI